jgi:uncharacterized membrane protein
MIGLLAALRKEGRFETAMLLFAMSGYCFALSVFRYWLTGSRLFLFLNWNLFLAVIPWAAAAAVESRPRLRASRPALAAVLLIWILFFPNSPYILTDLVHLQARPHIPFWFDLVLILGFAWTGLSFGFLSLIDIESVLGRWLPRLGRMLAISGLLYLSGFGIYLGRYLRWNSWDVLQSPFGLLGDIGDRFSDPVSHSRTWGFTILMGTLLNMMYWTLRSIRRAGPAATGAPSA